MKQIPAHYKIINMTEKRARDRGRVMCRAVCISVGKVWYVRGWVCVCIQAFIVDLMARPVVVP